MTTAFLKHDTARCDKSPYQIWIICGAPDPSKSSTSTTISKALNAVYIDGDISHPLSNGDSETWDHLISLCDTALKKIAAGNEKVVVSCCASKRKYRDVMRLAGWYDQRVCVRFVLSSVGDLKILDADERDVFFFDEIKRGAVIEGEVLSAALNAG